MQLFQHVFKSSTIFPQNNHRHMIKFTSVLSSHFHNIRKHYFPSAAKYWGFERCFWTTWLVLVQVQVWLRYRTRDTRYVDCRVTTESVPRKLAQYRVVMTAAEFWSHSAPAHTCHPRRLESHPAVKVATTFRRNNIWRWCLIAPCWKPIISLSHLQMFKYPFMRVS